MGTIGVLEHEESFNKRLILPCGCMGFNKGGSHMSRTSVTWLRWLAPDLFQSYFDMKVPRSGEPFFCQFLAT
jgi:hypothetical protein